MPLRIEINTACSLRAHQPATCAPIAAIGELPARAPASSFALHALPRISRAATSCDAVIFAGVSAALSDSTSSSPVIGAQNGILISLPPWVTRSSSLSFCTAMPLWISADSSLVCLMT